VCVTVIKYQVDVYTGDVWGGGTDANIYITLYGDRGDTGVRQLYAETKGVYFKQGQVGRFLFHTIYSWFSITFFIILYVHYDEFYCYYFEFDLNRS